MKHVPLLAQTPECLVRRVAGHLRHRPFGGIPRDHRRAYAPGLQMEEEKDVIGAGPRQVSTSTVKKSTRANTAMWEETNSFQVVFWHRRGAGAMPCRLCTFATV